MGLSLLQSLTNVQFIQINLKPSGLLWIHGGIQIDFMLNWSLFGKLYGAACPDLTSFVEPEFLCSWRSELEGAVVRKSGMEITTRLTNTKISH